MDDVCYLDALPDCSNEDGAVRIGSSVVKQHLLRIVKSVLNHSIPHDLPTRPQSHSVQVVIGVVPQPIWHIAGYLGVLRATGLDVLNFLEEDGIEEGVGHGGVGEEPHDEF